MTTGLKRILVAIVQRVSQGKTYGIRRVDEEYRRHVSDCPIKFLPIESAGLGRCHDFRGPEHVN